MAPQKKNVETIFSSALQRTSAGERTAYLDGACGDDAALRARVEELLRAHEEADTFLSRPTAEARVVATPSGGSGDSSAAGPSKEGPGTRIGRYKLLQQIGEGGFGEVYMAEQEEPVRRKVALKIIKLGMDTKQVIGRFEAERQALAMMDHPNIAKVLDAGATATGRPYFVMELVKGIAFTEYCDKNNLSTRARLALFVPVCNAIQHAHNKGIIHRDIKPNNVLVTLHDGKPVPKVIDFGVAKATNQRLTEQTVFTEFRQFIGTPEYMSPEQAEMSGLDIDTRSDIYSLGVLLYEILTGTTPFDSKTLRQAGYLEITRMIREDEPPAPSTRLSMLGDDLSEIARHRHTEPGVLSKLMRGDLRAQEYLKALFAAFAEPVRRHKGAIDDYVGDAAIVTWPLERGIKSARCIRCVFDILDDIEANEAKWRASFGQVPRLRAALHGGVIITAEIGVDHHKIAFFGDTVNTTARLESLCKSLGKQVLISSELAQRIKLPKTLDIEDLGAHAVKGRGQTLGVMALKQLQKVEVVQRLPLPVPAE